MSPEPTHEPDRPIEGESVAREALPIDYRARAREELHLWFRGVVAKEAERLVFDDLARAQFERSRAGHRT